MRRWRSWLCAFLGRHFDKHDGGEADEWDHHIVRLRWRCRLCGRLRWSRPKNTRRME